MWLDRVKKHYGSDLEINWRNFCLEQANSKEGPEWKLWEQPDDYPSRGFLALRAGEAARRQGEEAFNRFSLVLLTARHEERKDISSRELLEEIAAETGLDLERFRKDLGDRSILKKIAEDHTEGVEKHGVFGVPTFIFPNGRSAFLKMLRPPEEDSVDVFDLLIRMMGEKGYVGEIKRPQPPWPQGAFD